MARPYVERCIAQDDDRQQPSKLTSRLRYGIEINAIKPQINILTTRPISELVFGTLT